MHDPKALQIRCLRVDHEYLAVLAGREIHPLGL